MRILFLLAAALQAQTPIPQLVKQALPSVFLMGGEYSSSASPHFSGFASIAVPVSNPAGLYSYSLYQAVPVHGKIATSTTTGAADDLKTACFKAGCAVLVGLVTAGVSSSGSTQLAAAGGGGVLWRWNSGWAAAAFVINNTVGGTNKPSYLIGFGRTW